LTCGLERILLCLKRWLPPTNKSWKPIDQILKRTLGESMLCKALFITTAFVAIQSTALAQENKAGAQTIKVVMATLTSDSLNLVAKSEGFFAKRGLNVVFVVSNPTMLTSVVASGQADIGLHATGIPLSINAAGRKTAIIFATTGGGQGGSMFGAPGLTAVEPLKGRTGCKIGTLSAGTSAAGYAVLYKQQLGLPCDIVPFQDIPSQIGALSAKHIDAIVGAYPNFAPAVADGKATLVVDTRDPEQSQKYLGDPFPEVVAFGLADNLASKRSAIVSYLQALADAQSFIETTPIASIAEAEKRNLPELSERPLAVVESDLKALQAYRWRGSDRGHITEPQWKLALSRIALWGLSNFSVENPVFSYSAAVDMSYYEAAFKK
jgi:ABC-type nitrate/sulfonate/bicarbonate transport system substrate-binding protein